jgi:hypothetical protein
VRIFDELLVLQLLWKMSLDEFDLGLVLRLVHYLRILKIGLQKDLSQEVLPETSSIDLKKLKGYNLRLTN